MNRRDALKQAGSPAQRARSHLVKAAIEESVDLQLVEGQLLHLSSVVQTEVHQVFPRRCSGVEENTKRSVPVVAQPYPWSPGGGSVCCEVFLTLLLITSFYFLYTIPRKVENMSLSLKN